MLIILNTFVDVANGVYKHDIKTTSDVGAITVKYGTTSQTFNRYGDVFPIIVSIEQSKKLEISLFNGEELLGSFFEFETIGAEVVTHFEMISYTEEELIFSSEVLIISSTDVGIVESTEYDRGLNDGLVLGKFI